MYFLFSASAQNYSTWGEIYDYDIGDIFHYKRWVTVGYGYENIEIFDKTYSLDSNSVTYYRFFQKAMYSYYPPYDTGYWEWIDSLTYSDLNSVFYADQIDSSQQYNYRKQSHYNYDQPPDIYDHGHYVDGCGHGYEYYYKFEYGNPTILIERSLIYYKKGDEEWGTPHIVTSVEETQNLKDDLFLYPNPARDIVHINSSCDIEEMKVYNNTGKLEKLISNGSNELEVSGLNSGLYILQIKTNIGLVSRKLIIE